MDYVSRQKAPTGESSVQTQRGKAQTVFPKPLAMMMYVQQEAESKPITSIDSKIMVK